MQKKIINKHLKKIQVSIGEEIVLIDEATIEKDFGWVFFYDSKKGVDTGNFLDSLYGNTPLIVDREDGCVYETGTAYPVEVYIENYKREKGKNSLRAL